LRVQATHAEQRSNDEDIADEDDGEWNDSDGQQSDPRPHKRLVVAAR